MVIYAAYGCYNISERGKGKGISLSSIPIAKIKPEKRIDDYSTLGEDGQ